MRRPAAAVFLTATALALAGCGGQVGGSSGWTQKAGSTHQADATTPAPSHDDLASCLEGTWSLDENVMTALFQAGFVEGLSTAQPGLDATIDSLTATQTVTFDADETFTSQTSMHGTINATLQGQTVTIDMTIDASASGTWRVDGTKMAITTTDGSGTMTMQANGQTQDEDLGDGSDVVMLPSQLEKATCTSDTLSFDGQGMSMAVPDAPASIVFTRQ